MEGMSEGAWTSCSIYQGMLRGPEGLYVTRGQGVQVYGKRGICPWCVRKGKWVCMSSCGGGGSTHMEGFAAVEITQWETRRCEFIEHVKLVRIIEENKSSTEWICRKDVRTFIVRWSNIPHFTLLRPLSYTWTGLARVCTESVILRWGLQ